MYHIFFIHYSVAGHLGFDFPAIMNKTAIWPFLRKLGIDLPQDPAIYKAYT